MSLYNFLMKCALVDSYSLSSLPSLLVIQSPLMISPQVPPFRPYMSFTHTTLPHQIALCIWRCNGPADIFMDLFLRCTFSDSLPLRGCTPECIFLPVVFSAAFLLKVSSDLSRSILLSLWKELNVAQKFPPVLTHKV